MCEEVRDVEPVILQFVIEGVVVINRWFDNIDHLRRGEIRNWQEQEQLNYWNERRGIWFLKNRSGFLYFQWRLISFVKSTQQQAETEFQIKCKTEIEGESACSRFINCTVEHELAIKFKLHLSITRREIKIYPLLQPLCHSVLTFHSIRYLPLLISFNIRRAIFYVTVNTRTI